MITIDLGELEYYNGDDNTFETEVGGKVSFEYSLRAVYNWEGRWKKPFLKGDVNEIEMIDFYKEMALEKIDERFITEDVMVILAQYISNPSTATTFSSNNVDGGKNTVNGKIHTAEELYALMIMSNIPLEFETRNLNRLLTIMRIIGAKNSPPKKMNREDILKQNSQLNAERKKKFNTKG